MSLMAVNTNNQINPDLLLGYLEFHSIPDLRIPKADLAALWSKHGLPMLFLPGEIRPCDAFRRATASAQKTVQVNWKCSQYTAKLLVREVKSDPAEIVRLLVREIVDSKNEVLDYAIAGKVTFERSNGTVKTWSDWQLLSEYGYDSILRHMEYTYNEFISYHTRDTVRNLINKVLRSTNPVSIIPHSQGKFIPKRNHGLLMGLKALFSDLRRYSKGEDCNMDLIPMVNTADQRELVARRATIELTGELDTLVTELAEQLQKGNDTNINTVQRLTNRAIELQERAKEYEKLVNVRLNVLRSQLTAFINRVKIVPAENKVG